MKNKLLKKFLIIILSILLVKISKKDTFDADAIFLKDINYQTLEIISDNDKIKKILNKLNSIYEIDDVYKTDFAYEILLVKMIQNNNEYRRLITLDILNKINWLDYESENWVYNQKKEKVAKYYYEFQL